MIIAEWERIYLIKLDATSSDVMDPPENSRELDCTGVITESNNHSGLRM